MTQWTQWNQVCDSFTAALIGMGYKCTISDVPVHTSVGWAGSNEAVVTSGSCHMYTKRGCKSIAIWRYTNSLGLDAFTVAVCPADLDPYTNSNWAFLTTCGLSYPSLPGEYTAGTIERVGTTASFSITHCFPNWYAGTWTWDCPALGIILITTAPTGATLHLS